MVSDNTVCRTALTTRCLYVYLSLPQCIAGQGRWVVATCSIQWQVYSYDPHRASRAEDALCGDEVNVYDVQFTEEECPYALLSIQFEVYSMQDTLQDPLRIVIFAVLQG